jgi:hypothetical protein
LPKAPRRAPWPVPEPRRRAPLSVASACSTSVRRTPCRSAAGGRLRPTVSQLKVVE